MPSVNVQQIWRDTVVFKYELNAFSLVVLET